MARYHTDCRDYPSAVDCTVAISADGQDELLEAAVQHAVNVHKYQDTSQFRAELRRLFKPGSPAQAQAVE